MSQDILIAIEPEPTRAELVGRTRALMERLGSDEGRDEIIVLRPESLEPITLDSLPDYDGRCKLLGGSPTVTSTKTLPHHTMQLDDRVLLGPGATLNFIASLLYGTGHPICGVVLLVPRSLTE